jgi:hypothetical protein
VRAGWRIRRLADGSALVARRVGRAFAPVDDDGELRLLATAVRSGSALWVGSGILGHAHPSPLWLAAGTCAWCVAAWRAEPDTEAQQEQQAEAGPEQYDPEATRDALTRLLHDRIAGQKGVHLTTLVDALHKVGKTGWTVPALRQHYEAYGIPVRSQLYLGGSNRAGVHRDDLTAVPVPQPDSRAAS